MPLGAHKATLFGVAGVSTGDVVLLSTQTASDSASIDFTSGITSTYGEYIFKFYNINPANDSVDLSFQVNATDGADYNDSNITAIFFAAQHDEADSATDLDVDSGRSVAQTTDFMALSGGTGNGADESCAGEFHLFNPASTTYVKNFYSVVNQYSAANAARVLYASGYINDTTAVDDIQFKMSAGNFDGTIKMWGVKN
jgi:hypothetical protein